jgi:BTB/POZ domain
MDPSLIQILRDSVFLLGRFANESLATLKHELNFRRYALKQPRIPFSYGVAVRALAKQVDIFDDQQQHDDDDDHGDGDGDGHGDFRRNASSKTATSLEWINTLNTERIAFLHHSLSELINVANEHISRWDDIKPKDEAREFWKYYFGEQSFVSFMELCLAYIDCMETRFQSLCPQFTCEMLLYSMVEPSTIVLAGDEPETIEVSHEQFEYWLAMFGTLKHSALKLRSLFTSNGVAEEWFEPFTSRRHSIEWASENRFAWMVRYSNSIPGTLVLTYTSLSQVSPTPPRHCLIYNLGSGGYSSLQSDVKGSRSVRHFLRSIFSSTSYQMPPPEENVNYTLQPKSSRRQLEIKQAIASNAAHHTMVASSHTSLSLPASASASASTSTPSLSVSAAADAIRTDGVMPSYGGAVLSNLHSFTVNPALAPPPPYLNRPNSMPLHVPPDDILFSEPVLHNMMIQDSPINLYSKHSFLRYATEHVGELDAAIAADLPHFAASLGVDPRGPIPSDLALPHTYDAYGDIPDAPRGSEPDDIQPLGLGSSDDCRDTTAANVFVGENKELSIGHALSDMVICMGDSDTMFPVHAFVIRARCPVLYQRALVQYAVTNPTAICPSTSALAIRALLTFLYTGTLPVMVEIMVELYDLGQQFDIPELQRITAHFANDPTTVTTVASLSHAVLCCERLMQLKLREFLVTRMARDILELVCFDDFAAIPARLLSDVLRSQQLRCTEMEATAIAVEWATRHAGVLVSKQHSFIEHLTSIASVGERDISSAATFCTVFGAHLERAQRDRMANLLATVVPSIRFPLIESKDIYHIIEPLRIVPNDLLLEAYRYHALAGGIDSQSIRCKHRQVKHPESELQQLGLFVLDTGSGVSSTHSRLDLLSPTETVALPWQSSAHGLENSELQRCTSRYAVHFKLTTEAAKSYVSDMWNAYASRSMSDTELSGDPQPDLKWPVCDIALRCTAFDPNVISLLPLADDMQLHFSLVDVPGSTRLDINRTAIHESAPRDYSKLLQLETKAKAADSKQHALSDIDQTKLNTIRLHLNPLTIHLAGRKVARAHSSSASHTSSVLGMSNKNDTLIELPAHRYMLARRIMYFASIFGSHMADAKDRVLDLSHLDARAMQIVLQYLYTGVLTVNYTLLPAIIMAADYLQATDLKKKCLLKLNSNECIQYALHVWYASHRFHAAGVRQLIERHVYEQATIVLLQPAFMFLSEHMVAALFGNTCDLLAPELYLFVAALRWAKFRCVVAKRSSIAPLEPIPDELLRRVRVTVDELRMIMSWNATAHIGQIDQDELNGRISPFLPLLYWNCMTQAQFERFVQPHNLPIAIPDRFVDSVTPRNVLLNGIRR